MKFERTVTVVDGIHHMIDFKNMLDKYLNKHEHRFLDPDVTPAMRADFFSELCAKMSEGDNPISPFTLNRFLGEGICQETPAQIKEREELYSH